MCLLRGEESATGAMRIPPVPCDDGHNVRGPKAIRVGKGSVRAAVPVSSTCRRNRLCRAHTSLVGARSLWGTAADDKSDPPIPRWDESLHAE